MKLIWSTFPAITFDRFDYRFDLLTSILLQNVRLLLEFHPHSIYTYKECNCITMCKNPKYEIYPLICDPDIDVYKFICRGTRSIRTLWQTGPTIWYFGQISINYYPALILAGDWQKCTTFTQIRGYSPFSPLVEIWRVESRCGHELWSKTFCGKV